MSVVLVTGGTGFLGSRLIPKLALEHEVIALSRRKVAGVQAAIRGSFTSREDLRVLDQYKIESVVHLAAELLGASEEACFSTNVVGTGTLLRYMVDHGCRHFILASSIAAIGCMSEGFLPGKLPIPDDHPSHAVDPYGLSKALMEEVALYFGRQDPGIEITLFRIGGVLDEDLTPSDNALLVEARLPFLAGGLVAVSDVVDAFALSVRRRLGPGVRRINLVGPVSRTRMRVPDALRTSLGDRAFTLDTSYYETGSSEIASLYSRDRLFHTYGAQPIVDVGAVVRRRHDNLNGSEGGKVERDENH